MSMHTRSSSSRAIAGEIKQQSINENRVAGSGVGKTILKPKAIHGRSILSSTDMWSINTKTAEANPAPGTKGSAGHTANNSTASSQKMAAVASRKPRVPLSAVDPSRTQVYRDPAPRPARLRRAAASAADQAIQGVLAPKESSNGSTAAAPRKVLRSSSASNILPTKPSNKILVCKPTAVIPTRPAVTVVIEPKPQPLAGIKRRATAADAEDARVVRAKTARETTHIERSDSATEVSVSCSASARSVASQDTAVETHSSCSADSRADSQSTVVEGGVSAEVAKRKIAKPSRTFSSATYKPAASSDPFYDFDEDVKSKEKKESEEPDYDDIDAEDADDPLMVSEYIVEIMEYMHSLESKCMPDETYMTKQVDLNWEMRRVLINWIVQTHYQLRMLPETLFLAVNLVDRFLSKRQVSVSKLQLVGLTGLLLASKYEEMTTPQIQDFAYLAGNCYSVEEIKNAEVFMLRVLDFDLSYPNPLTFLRRVSKAEQYNMQTRTVAKYLMEICLVDHRLMRFTPSHIAAAGICLARRMLDAGVWDSNLRHYSGYSEADLQPCISLMIHHLLNTPKDEFVFKKFQHRRFLKASLFCREWVARHRHEFVRTTPPIGHFAATDSFATSKPSVSRTSSDISETF